MTTVSDRIIDALGGTTAVGNLTDTPLSTVHSWRRNGIPRSRLAHLKLVAEREGKALDWDTGLPLEAGNGVPADHTDTDTIAADTLSHGKVGENSTGQVSA